MSDIIKDTTPLNIKEEKERFWADETYNPQFVYRRDIAPAELTIWGLPQDRYTEHAQRFLSQYADSVEAPTSVVNEDEVRDAIVNFNQSYQVQPPLDVIFSENLVASCKITRQAIYFRTPLKYSHTRFDDLCRHELESHLLRALNHETQPWKDISVPEEEIRRTEEGVASLHTFLLREKKVVMRSYTTYVAVSLAQKHSFRQVFNQLRAFGLTKELSWRLCLRTKRGVTDTSLPGGLTRDICYFEGTVAVWDWLINQHQNPLDLYLGRLSLAAIPNYKQQANLSQLHYPSFMSNLDEYLHHITEIGTINNFTQLT